MLELLIQLELLAFSTSWLGLIKAKRTIHLRSLLVSTLLNL